MVGILADELIAQSYERMLRKLPGHLIGVARTMPFRLGIASRPDDGWDVFTSHPPMYDLPRFAVDMAAHRGMPISRQQSDLFGHIHRCACFFFLTYDRFLDGQAEPGPEEQSLLRHFRRHWEMRLLDACGNGAASTLQAIETDIDIFKAGAASQSSALREKQLSVPHYANTSIQKAQWLTRTTLCMLDATGNSHLCREFRDIFEQVLLAMQCFDDALDIEEDTTLWGCDVPRALGISGEGLRRAATLLLSRAGSQAEEAALLSLSKWISRYHDTVQNTRFACDADLASFEAVGVLTQMPTFR